MEVTIKVDIPNAQGIANRILSKNVKLYANTRLHAYCSPYVPMDTGNLDQNVDITPEYVHYKAPYANRVWNGEGMNFSTDKHPLATSHPERAAMAAKGQQLANDITAYVKSR